MVNFIKKVQSLHLVEWCIGLICFIVGLLLILGNALSNNNLYNLASIFLGVVLIILGTGVIIYNALKKKMLCTSSLIGAVVLALGIASIAESLGLGIISLILMFCPYLLITLGALFMISINVDLFNNKSFSKSRVLILCTGILMFVFGFLIISIEALSSNKKLLGGIILILIGISVILNVYFGFAKNLSKSSKKIKETLDNTQKED